MHTKYFLAGLLTVCSTLHAAPPADAEKKAETLLPKVVLVGDSIRLSYAPKVAEQLNGQVQIISAAANGQDSRNVLKNLPAWVLNKQPAIVHFNCGIHDIKKTIADGSFQVSPEQYEKNLREIVKQIRENTEAIVIFATTTPLHDQRASDYRKGRDYELLNASIQQYNAIALKVMEELEVPVNDLNAAIATPADGQSTDDLIASDGVHMTPAAQKVLANQVSETIRQHLK